MYWFLFSNESRVRRVTSITCIVVYVFRTRGVWESPCLLTLNTTLTSNHTRLLCSSPTTASARPPTMSKPTTSEVISRGEYLEPDFNPASLTIAHLLGILGYHDVKYPSQHTKAKLVQIFNDEIKPNTSKFKRERLSRQNSQASDEGIKDGVSGEFLNGGRKVRLMSPISSFITHCNYCPSDTAGSYYTRCIASQFTSARCRCPCTSSP